MSTRNQRGVEQGAGADAAPAAVTAAHTPAGAAALEQQASVAGGGVVRAGAERIHARGRQAGEAATADAPARTAHTSWEAPVARGAWDIERSARYGHTLAQPTAFDRFVFRSWPAFKSTAWAAGERMLAHPVSAAAFCLGLCAGVVAVGVLLMLPLAFIGHR